MRTLSSSTSIAVQSPALPLPVFPGGTLLGTLQKSGGLLSRAWNWIRERQVVRSCQRRLHVAATVSLGEKRFVALVQMDGLEFLVGGGAQNVVLLAQLNGKEQFEEVLQERIASPAAEVGVNPPVEPVAASVMRPKVERLINATARKTVRPSIEQFVRPVERKQVRRTAKVAAEPAAEQAAIAATDASPKPRAQMKRAAKSSANPVGAKSVANPVTKPAAEASPEAVPASLEKAQAGDAAVQPAKPEVKKTVKQTTKTVAKRTGK